jgi:hypothetical protein
MMKTTARILSGTFSMIVVLMLFAGAYAVPGRVLAAADADTQAGKTGITYQCQDANCTYADVIAAIEKVIKWAVEFALVFSVIVIAYAGFLYMTSGDSATKRSQANGMFVKALYGIFYMLAAWLIITFIAKALLSDTAIKALPFNVK